MRLFIAIGGIALAIGLGLAYQFFVANGETPMVMDGAQDQNGRAAINPNELAPPPSADDESASTEGDEVSPATTPSPGTDQLAEAPSPAPAQAQAPAETTPATSAIPEELDGPVRLSIPVVCELGRTCLLFSYPNAGTVQQPADYACGPMTRAAETSTEFRLIDYVDMELGVSVLAAAPGTVRAVRDDLPDVSYRLLGLSAVVDEPLGNFVEIEHRDGVVTTYSHMRRGSARVSVGDAVARGQTIGEVGMSGLTEHPVLGFEVARNGLLLDPFTGLLLNAECGEPTDSALWRDDEMTELDYKPAFLLLAFADRVLNRAAFEYYTFREALPADADALVLHAYLMGIREGDAFVAEILDPTGARFVKSGRPFEQSAQIELLAVGKQDLDEPLLPGEYEATFQLFRPDPTTGALMQIRSSSISITVE